VTVGRAASDPPLDKDTAPGPVLPPVDADGQPRVVGADADVAFEVTTVDAKTGNPVKVFHPGDKMRFKVVNTGKTMMHFEIIALQASGEIVVLMDGIGTMKPGEERLFPSKESKKFKDGYEIDALDEGDTPRQKCVVYAASTPFKPGVLLSMGDKKKRPAGYAVTDRFVHTFYRIEDGRVVADFNPAKMVKQTAVFEVAPK
jgi:hypothetical protein